MRNIKEEIQKNFAVHDIKCAAITYDNPHYFEEDKDREIVEANLYIGYTIEDMENFLAILNFEYDNGYGSQMLYGTIWFNDGTWATRGEYDGSEWWEHHVCPEIPDKLK